MRPVIYKDDTPLYVCVKCIPILKVNSGYLCPNCTKFMQQVVENATHHFSPEELDEIDQFLEENRDLMDRLAELEEKEKLTNDQS